MSDREPAARNRFGEEGSCSGLTNVGIRTPNDFSTGSRIGQRMPSLNDGPGARCEGDEQALRLVRRS